MAQPSARHVTPGAWLAGEYTARRARNPYYSKRAFARQLGISSGRLTELLNGKRAFTPLIARRIAERLSLTSERRNVWLAATEAERLTRDSTRKLERLVGDDSAPSAELDEDMLRAICGWHHLAILSLLRVPGFVGRADWIGRRLGIPADEAGEAWLRLVRLGLVRRRGQHWARAQSRWRTKTDVPSEALRFAHRGFLDLAARSLDEVPVELRDITSITMAIDPASLPRAKKLIRNFRRALSDYFESGKPKEVYHLSVALFPLSKSGGRA